MTIMIITSVINISETQVRFTKKIGGDNGTSFMLPSSRQAILSTDRITGIAIQHGRRIEQIELEYSSAEGFNLVEHIGNDAGEWSYIDLEPGEFITYITGQAGTLIDQITVHTSLRRTFGPYGGSGGQYFELTVPPNAMIIGFTGKAGPSIKQLGLIYKLYNVSKGEITKRSERGIRYEGKGISDFTKSSPRTVRDHRTKNSSKKNHVKDHKFSDQSSFTIRDSIALIFGDGSTHNVIKQTDSKHVYWQANRPSTPPGVPIPYPNFSTVKDKKPGKKIIKIKK